MVVEDEIFNDIQTNGIIGPHSKMLGPVADGGKIIFRTAPGCWGPMITPTIRGGHEVNMPVAVEGAEIGDGIVIKIKSIKVLSKAASSGVDVAREGAFVGDPYVAKKCPSSDLLPALKGEGSNELTPRQCGEV